MKGEITLKILEAIADAAMDFGTLVEAILVSGYGASASKIEYTKSMLKRERARNDQEQVHSKQKLYMMLSKLKRDGLIQENTKHKKNFFSLTMRGIQKLSTLKNQGRIQLPPPSKYAEGREGERKLVILTFDIPEKERRKRDWLRAVLKTLNFSMVQKSVWIGKTKLPAHFLEDLENMRLLDFVEIFEINKAGSLRHVI